MFLTRSEYDRGVNTFSPEGRLFQVEYAIEAIKLGSTAIGIRTPEGVVMAVEKRITSPLMEPSTVEKIVEVDRHIGCATSGLMADARYEIYIEFSLQILIHSALTVRCVQNLNKFFPSFPPKK